MKDKQIVNNYCPVSLLPLCSIVLDKVVFEDGYFLNYNRTQPPK